MRIWKDPKGNLVDDERVLAFLASCGSLSAAAKAGEIELVSESAPEGIGSRACSNHGKKLADYLREGAQ